MTHINSKLLNIGLILILVAVFAASFFSPQVDAAGSAPVASFTYTAAGFTPFPDQFTDTSANTPTSWQWCFGDNSANSTSQNPNHMYSYPGVYKVTETATNLYGSSSVTQTVTVVEPGQTSWSYMPVRAVYIAYELPEYLSTAETTISTAHSDGYNTVFFQNAGTLSPEDLAAEGSSYNSSLQSLINYTKTLEMQFILFADTDMPAPEIALENGYQNDVAAAPCINVSFVVSGNMAIVVADPAVAIINPAFANKLTGWGKLSGSATVTSSAPAGYSNSAEFAANGAGNRIYQYVTVAPYHEYDFTYWEKSTCPDGTEGENAPIIYGCYENGSPNANYKLYYDSGYDPAEFGWTKFNEVFNSLNNTQILISIGSWDSGGGDIYVTGMGITEVGVLNIVRNPVTPVSVVAASGSANGTVYTEGVDYDYLSDPNLGNSIYHTIPTITIPSGSRITNGETLNVSFYDEQLQYSDGGEQANNGWAAMDLNDPNVISANGLLNTNMKNIQSVADPTGLAVDFDQMMEGGYSVGSPASYGIEIGQALQTIQSDWTAINSSAPLYTWEDMFDPYGNSQAYYFDTNNGTAGSSAYLNPGMIMLNWNMGIQQSADYFGYRGIQQIFAGYYDNLNYNPAPWIAQSRADGDQVDGAIYVTWENNYKGVGTFASDVWGSMPVASFSVPSNTGTAPFRVQFTDTSINKPTSWEWNFGDGSSNSTAENPSHTYTLPGDYTVTMTAKNSGGSTTVVATLAIAVQTADTGTPTPTVTPTPTPTVTPTGHRH
jgi:PKD repeat protein